MANGAGVGFAAQHSQSVENWFLNVPGLKMCVPATPADAYSLLRAAIRDDNPTLVFEHKGLYALHGEVDLEREPATLGAAEIVRKGDDVTVVATQLMRHRAEEAADRLADEGIVVELIDPRTLAPLDLDTIVASVEKTSRLACVQEASPNGSWGATVIGRVAERAFQSLDASPVLIGGDETPIPYAASLEEAWLPSVERIASGIRALAEE
jgi:pyruvate dehydrogenase E1 component beta subunit